MSLEFEGRRALITGGARGLGKTIAEAFAKQGAEVIVIDKRSDLLESVKNELNVTAIDLDVTSWAEVRRVIEQLGPIHHLVNNAGISKGMKLPDVTESYVNKMMDVNFKAVLNITEAVIKNMPEGGTVVNISSILANLPFQNDPLYSCTKAAVSMLTKCQALEYGPRKIRVNSVRPSFMPTPLFGSAAAVEQNQQAFVSKQVLKDSVQTSDTADLVLFLSSSKSKMITGEDMLIDGGLTWNQFNSDFLRSTT